MLARWAYGWIHWFLCPLNAPRLPYLPPYTSRLRHVHTKSSCVEDEESFFSQPPIQKHFLRRQPENLIHHANLSHSIKTLTSKVDQTSDIVATFVELLKKFTKVKALSDGRHLHTSIKQGGYDTTPLIGNLLIRMYSNCGSVQEAQAAFYSILQPDRFSWTALITAYGSNGDLDGAMDVFHRMPHPDVVACTILMGFLTQNKRGNEALQLFYEMVLDDCLMPDKFAFACAVDACSVMASFEDGKLIHATIVGSNSSVHMVLETSLIMLYGNCGSLSDARNVFDKLPCRDVVCWNAMISACVQNEHDKEAVMLFHQMQIDGTKMNSITYVCVLNACANLLAHHKGQSIHLAIMDSGHEQQPVISTALINMYGKCKQISRAKEIFVTLTHHDVVSWTSMMGAFIHNGELDEALSLFHQMQAKGIEPDDITFVCVVDACAELADVAVALYLHAYIVQTKHAGHALIANAVFNMYIKCGRFWDAKTIFNTLPCLDVTSWNALLGALFDHECYKEALCLFCEVYAKNLRPNEVTYVYGLGAYTKISGREDGCVIHTAVVEDSYECHLMVSTELVNMYGKDGRLHDAESVFGNMPDRDIVAWNALMKILIEFGEFQRVLDVFHHAERSGVGPTNFSFVSALEACIGLMSLEDGQEIHSTIVHTGCHVDVILGTALINMYGKCGCLFDARHVLEKLRCRDVVAFTSLIIALVQNGMSGDALDLFAEMLYGNISPDSVSLICAIEACASLMTMEVGLLVHTIVVESGFEHGLKIGSGLVSMYGKCGNLESANKVFSGMCSSDDIAIWNAMLGMLAHNGHGMAVEALLFQMQCNSIKPNYTTCVCILAAFSHAGMIDAGCHFFRSMTKEFNLEPMVDQYLCVCDLLGRAGQLSTVEALIHFMPFQRMSFAWRCLLGACNLHNDMERGERIANFCFEENAESDAPYVILSNLYVVVDTGDALISGPNEEHE